MTGFGAWASPLSAATVAAAATRLGHVVVDGSDVHWLEGRPAKAGRGVVVRRDSTGRVEDATPAGTDVRTRVHETGGGPYAVSEGVIYFSNFADQRLYRLRPGEEPVPMTPPGPWRYADATIDASRRVLVCVREDHADPDREAEATLVSIALDGRGTEGEVVVSGHDFYSTPRFSPDGRQLCWLAWNHPQMPWDGTELWRAEVVERGRIGRASRVAGGSAESVFQPGWSPAGELYFVSDRTGWWNLYRLGGDEPEAIAPLAADFGRPQWTLGISTWAFADPSRIVAACAGRGRWRLVVIDVNTRAVRPLPTTLEPGDSVCATATHAVVVAGSERSPDAVVSIELTSGATGVIRTASSAPDPDLVSVAEAIEFATADRLTAHAFHYAPRNPRAAAPEGELPPLIVMGHGGPTSAATARLNLEIQYWTSRGFAVVDVNYGGSTGYGRAYRERLKGRWGVVDVADCVNAARHLIAQRKADPKRLIARGRSAGGYLALAAVASHPGFFGAAAIYFGVADLERLRRGTHKFESRYLDGLIGPYPEQRALYRRRSPIHSADRVSCPVILFQGLDDRVVPPEQARLMAEAIRARGVRAELLMFEGEQHGFRKGETIARCLEAELAFYADVFGLRP
jgi:dipeptidyl aminopeptidase/acylaminoacyl peptidase